MDENEMQATTETNVEQSETKKQEITDNTDTNLKQIENEGLAINEDLKSNTPLKEGETASLATVVPETIDQHINFEKNLDEEVSQNVVQNLDITQNIQNEQDISTKISNEQVINNQIQNEQDINNPTPDEQEDINNPISNEQIEEIETINSSKPSLNNINDEIKEAHQEPESAIDEEKMDSQISTNCNQEQDDKATERVSVESQEVLTDGIQKSNVEECEQMDQQQSINEKEIEQPSITQDSVENSNAQQAEIEKTDIQPPNTLTEVEKTNETINSDESSNQIMQQKEINEEDQKKVAEIETSIVSDMIAAAAASSVTANENLNNDTDMEMIDTSDLKRNDVKELNQLVDSLINDVVCNPKSNELFQPSTNNSIKQDIDENDDDDNNDAVADVVAAVEASAAKAAANGTISHATNNTPKSVKKKASKSNASPTKGSSSLVNHIGNSSVNNLNNSLNNDTSPLSSSQKRRKKDPSAPKAPLNGYLVYFNEERAEMRSKNPGMGFGDLTKIIAAKWKELPSSEKQRYVDEAELDKERYLKEMAEYKNSDGYKQYLKDNTQAAKLSRLEDPTSSSHTDACFIKNTIINGGAQSNNNPNMSWLQNESSIAGFDIPIFTEEFIEHSKNREQEMRQLRKELNELEQQNNVLNNHIENLKQSTNKTEQDIEHFKNTNNQLQKNLDIFRQTILQFFCNMPLPNTQDYPTQSNIDEYIMRLYSIVNATNQHENNPNMNMNDQFYQTNRSFASHVKSVFSKINFNSLFENI